MRCFSCLLVIIILLPLGTSFKLYGSDGDQTVMNRNLQEASQAEKMLAQDMENLTISKAEVLRKIAALSTEPFVMRETWIYLSRSQSLDNWRRLESYKFVIYRCMTYPHTYDEFFDEAIRPMGIDAKTITDMAKASFLPLERRSGTKIFMVNLPIVTDVGRAAVYFAVERSSNTVERAVVYPDSINPEV